jgi:release factor glutamine methyltransferase
LYFEINEALGNSITELMTSFGYSDVRIVSDINTKERIIKGTKNG